MTVRDPALSARDQTVGELLDDLGAARLSGAAGYTAAVTAALAAALAAAAASSAPRWEEGAGIVAQCDALRTRLLALGAQDQVAHHDASALLGRAARPETNDSGARPGDRDLELADALHAAALAPLAIAEAAADVASLSAWVARQIPHPGRAEALAAVSLARGATDAAADLVHVNLSVQSDDPLASRAKAAAVRAAEVHQGARQVG